MRHAGEPSPAKLAGCEYAEAFCLMLYRDKHGNEEWIWNSRDAVTPFIVTSREGLQAQHVEWHRDRFDPWHEPKIGDRIFVNLTIEHARGYRRTYVERFWGADMAERWPTKEAAIEELAAADVGSFGVGTTPSLIVVDRWLLADLKSRRLPRPSATGRSPRFA